MNKASAHQKNLDVGANIFIGNLDPEVDEKLLYDTFSAFGVILTTPKIQRDPDTGNSKGFAFINYASFVASDAAIEAMNGQYLCTTTARTSGFPSVALAAPAPTTARKSHASSRGSVPRTSASHAAGLRAARWVWWTTTNGRTHASTASPWQLDAATAGALLDLLLELQKEDGFTLIVVTHTPEIAARLGRIVRLDAGKLVEVNG